LSRFIFLLTLIFWGIPGLTFGASASPAVSLDSWVYPAIEKLAGLGLIESDLQGTRPWTRLEAARLAVEAQTRAEDADVPPVATEILARLHREFAPQLEELRDGAAESYLRPVREIRMQYVYQDGDPSTGAHVLAPQFSLNTNNFGIDYEEGHNLQLILEGDARLGRYFLIQVRPLFQLGESDADLTVLEGKAALQLGPFEISAGRQALWWGQGRHGSLILTNNAQPLDMLRITNPSPVHLPWILQHLGSFRFDVFWSRLEEDRVVAEPYLAGLRLNLKPVSWFELGASRAVMFGGEGRPDIDWDEFITILGGKNLEGDEDSSNSVAAIDARLSLPFLWGAQLYSELGGEDEAGAFIGKKAYLAGLYLPQIDPSGRLDLRLEYTDLNFQENGPVWYRHSVYRSGYTYEGKLLGHQAGGDSVDWFGELRLQLPNAATVALQFELLERGDSLPVQEKHLISGLRLDWPLTERIAAQVEYAFDRVRNFAYVEDDDRNFHFAALGLSSTF